MCIRDSYRIEQPATEAEAQQTRSLFNGVDLSGWHVDVPEADDNAEIEPSFEVRNGNLVSRGKPRGHLITDDSFREYRLTVEYRWTGKPGNCGVLVHASTPRVLHKMFPKSIECQMQNGNAGDFWCIGEDITVPDMVERRGPREGWGVGKGKRRRIRNLTDGSERPVGEWNEMVIECRGRQIDVWVNGDHVNRGTDCTADHGQIALQAEGAECEFRRIECRQLEPEVAKPEPQPVVERPEDFESWRHERMNFPTVWGPTLPNGSNHVLFPPGMFVPDSEDFWSYCYAAQLRTAPFDADGIEQYFETFYDGLLGMVGRGFVPDDPAQVEVRKVSENQFEAEIDLIDVFRTRKPLHVVARAHVQPNAAADEFQLLVRISPQPADHPVWQRLAGAVQEIAK